MTPALSASSRQSPAGGGGSDPQTKAEKSVHFINAEVLDPPAQGDLSFVGPYLDQTLAMAAEDARSFVQGAEQILLIALAKALKMALAGGAEVAVQAGEAGSPARLDASAPAHPTPSVEVGTNGLAAIQGMMASLSTFHASMAETALSVRRDR
jgi:hypothetical protein